MKRLFLTIAGMVAFIKMHAQVADTGFESRKLKIEEVNLVSSYYMQDGNNAAVTGGTGSEQLNDIANILDVKLTRYDKKFRKHSFDLEAGIDHYTSASSDKIDLRANSSASHADTRIYPSLSWSMENEQKGITIAAGLSASSEFDYKSFGANVSLSAKTKNRNGELTIKLQTYLDQVALVAPIELRSYSSENDYATTARNTYVASMSYSQIINQRLQMALVADIVQQQGYLSLPFHRVYFNDAGVHQEHLPDTRLKLPLGIRANYFFGDRVIIKSYYRYYTDTWGINANTFNIELPIKINPFFSVSPFYRFYNQTAAKYFAPYQQHTLQDEYYTSNYDVSKFDSHFLGAGVRISPSKGVFGIQYFSTVELRYGHYVRSTGLHSDIISINLKFK